jgi:hypothetical protein
MQVSDDIPDLHVRLQVVKALLMDIDILFAKSNVATTLRSIFITQ